MAIDASLAYGIALTDEFGGRFDYVPEALFDFAADFEHYGGPTAKKPPKGFTYMGTVEDPIIVLGVNVPTGDKGFSLDDAAAVDAIHKEFLAALAGLPEEMRLLAESMQHTPRLELMYGHY